MVRLEMAGHLKEVVTDPAFLVTRNMDDSSPGTPKRT
jgi:hypothetical protein